MSKKGRRFCFTDFELIDWTKVYQDNSDKIRYLCVGNEKCPKTGKQHKQGWIQFFNRVRYKTILNMANSSKLYLKACKGSNEDNDKYCQKEGDFIQFGTPATQGSRSDLDEIYKAIKQGASRKEIMELNFQKYCQYRKGIADAIEIATKEKSKDFRQVEVEYVYGPTGTGKTRYAMKHKDAFKIQGYDLKWFDGYEGETTLIIDEYSNDVPITKMLGLLDGYQLRIPIKGGHTYANWTKVIITSNLHPTGLHTSAKEIHRQALFRRITKQIYYPKLA